MLSRWPIRYKLLFGVSLVCLMVATLSFSGFRGPYAYRHLARSISRRATEIPRAAELTQSIAELRNAFGRLSTATGVDLHDQMQVDSPVMRREHFQRCLSDVKLALQRYREQLEQNDESDLIIDDDTGEWAIVAQIEQALQRLEALQTDQDWWLKSYQVSLWDQNLDELHRLSTILPTYLHQHMQELVDDVKVQYRTWIYLTWISSTLTGALLILLAVFFWQWLFQPLRVLVNESRRITAGDLRHRIQINTQDEVAELAAAMNDMTDAFQKIRDHLDEQVKQRTKEVVRSEQMASVGFLAAGVAHEINNPLASIAWCAESLESRLIDLFDEADEPSAEVAAGPASDSVVVRKYLKRIQDEAFRCKGITEKLLDFSRLGDVQRQPADLRELVQGVIEMVQTLGKYRQKHVEFHSTEHVVAPVNAQELKQVVLNLLTNALDSLDPGGQVRVELRKRGEQAELQVVDNGCGMSAEVLRHLYEPFFTRRRDGQGTGLGLSITYRIVHDHGGTIEAHSEGPGLGSRFRVLLPLTLPDKRRTLSTAPSDSPTARMPSPQPALPAAA